MAALVKDPSNTSNKQRGLTVTTARKSITSGSRVSQLVSTTVQRVQQPRPQDKADLNSSNSIGRRQQRRKEALPSVSSVGPEAIPGLRHQASILDPGQAKQREKGWGLSFKDPSVATPIRKEVRLHCRHILMHLASNSRHQAIQELELCRAVEALLHSSVSQIGCSCAK